MDHHFEWPFTVEDQIVLNARIESEDMLAAMEETNTGFDWLFEEK